MKTLNLIATCCFSFLIACNEKIENNSPAGVQPKVTDEVQNGGESNNQTSTNKPNLNNSRVHTKLYFQYLRESDTTTLQLNDEQDFIFQKKADLEMLKRHFAVVTSYNPKASRPVGLGITNVWGAAENPQTPRLDLKFFFKKKQIATGKTLECSTKESSECVFDVSTAKFNMNIPTKNIKCLLKIESELSLDFSEAEPSSTWRGISFPSSIDDGPFEGRAFAIAVACTADSKEIVNGYFQHNSSIIPNF